MFAIRDVKKPARRSQPRREVQEKTSGVFTVDDDAEIVCVLLV
jgi:hypothetical protein